MYDICPKFALIQFCFRLKTLSVMWGLWVIYVQTIPGPVSTQCLGLVSSSVSYGEEENIDNKAGSQIIIVFCLLPITVSDWRCLTLNVTMGCLWTKNTLSCSVSIQCVDASHFNLAIAFGFDKHANIGEFTPLRLFIDMEDVYSEFIMYI